MMTTGFADICEHYSHSMRTPLGVALGVVSDLVDGYQVSERDLKDAKAALERIRRLLDELRDLPGKEREEHNG